MKKTQAGFTLIEIAIVLVIIGLLLGGVLKGQEMITNSKITRTVNDYSGIAAAIYSYMDRYNALPGDDPNADARWGLGGSPSGGTVGDGIIDGAWNSTSSTVDETAAVWEHLRQAGLVTGAPDNALVATVSLPVNSFNGVIGVEDASAGTTGIATGVIICMNQIEGKIGEILDNKMDDGAGDAGDVQTDLADNPYVQATAYIECKKM